MIKKVYVSTTSDYDDFNFAIYMQYAYDKTLIDF